MASYVIQRRWADKFAIIGELLIDDQHECFTLERSLTLPSHPGIPAGTYHARKSLSPHMHYVSPELQDVPGRAGIRIHVANWYYELEGCTAVGTSYELGWANPNGDVAGAVFGSRAAFDALMSKLPEEFDVTYLDPKPEPEPDTG